MRISEAKATLRQLGVRPSKRLGQSFLVRDSVAARIARAAGEGGSVLEVGPGLGALTARLLERASQLCCVEISRELCGYLQGREDLRDARVVQADFLQVNPTELPGYPFIRFISNLPYSISTPALMRLTEPAFSKVGLAVVMLQREVARRITASPGCGDYGRLTLALWPRFSAEAILDAEPRDFYPQPAVRSRVLVLRRRDAPLVPDHLSDRFSWLVRVGFASRRKTLLNNLSVVMERLRASRLLDELGVHHKARAEELQPELFVRLAERLPL